MNIEHVAAALAILLTLPALWVGFVADDHLHQAILRGWICWRRHPATPYGLFTFIDGDPERIAQAIDTGLLPWWTGPGLSLSFFRPLTELSHGLDAWLWPGSAVAAHAVNIALYGAAVGVAARLFRALDLAPRAAAIAALVYAVDDGHALAVGWVAARSSLVAAVCAFACLLAHHRFRTTRHRRHRIAACAWLVGSLLAGESGLAVCGFLVAYACTLERSTGLARWSTLGPYGLVAIAWAAFYGLAGFGASGSGAYVDPFASVESMVTSMRWFVVLLASAIAGLPADFHVLAQEPFAAVYETIAGALVLLAAAVLVVPLWSRPTVRFFAIGGVLSLLPSLFTTPQDRLLVITTFASAGIVAEWLAVVAWATHRRSRTRVVAAVVVLVHGILPAAFLPWRTAAQPRSMQRALDDPARYEPRSGTERVVFVNPAIPFLSIYSDVLERERGRSRPRPFVLAPGIHGLVLTREDTTTLVVRGQPRLLQTRLDFLTRAVELPMRVGQEIRTQAAHIQVRAVDDRGQPTEVAARFTHDLDDGTIELVAWRGSDFGPMEIPAIGTSMTLPTAIGAAPTESRARLPRPAAP